MRQFAIGQGTVPLDGYPYPRTGVDLVNAERPFVDIQGLALLEPFLIAPLVAAFPDDRRRARRHFGIPGEGVGFVDPITIDLALDPVLVESTVAHPGDEALENARAVGTSAQGVQGTVPSVEIPYNRDMLGIGCPDGEVGSMNSVHGHWPSP